MTNAESADQNIRKLPTASENAAAEAREQADAYESMFGTTDLVLDDGDTIIKVPPHPSYGMLDDEAAEEYEELLFRMDTEYDREPDIDIPEQKLENGMVIPAETRRGALKLPYRINGERVTPSHNVRIAQIALGEKNYELLRAGGKAAADVWRIWGRQSIAVKERQATDSKSDGRDLDLAPVSETDS